MRASSCGVGIKETPSIFNPTPTPQNGSWFSLFPSIILTLTLYIFPSGGRTGECSSGRFYTSTYWLVTTFHACPAWRSTWSRKFLDKLEDWLLITGRERQHLRRNLRCWNTVYKFVIVWPFVTVGSIHCALKGKSSWPSEKSFWCVFCFICAFKDVHI